MLSELIALLKYAPSGGNLQPWVLKIIEHHNAVSIYIYLDANIHFEKQHTDHCGFGALISLGVLAYSIEYLCQDFGYRLINKTTDSEKDLKKSLYQSHWKSARLSRLSDRLYLDDDLQIDALTKQLHLILNSCKRLKPSTKRHSDFLKAHVIENQSTLYFAN